VDLGLHTSPSTKTYEMKDPMWLLFAGLLISQPSLSKIEKVQLKTMSLRPRRDLFQELDNEEFQHFEEQFNVPIETYDRIFGRLSLSQFTVLQERYHSNIKYAKNHQYRLSEFLPVKMRALLGKMLFPLTVKSQTKLRGLMGRSYYVNAPVAAFCTGSALELQRPGTRFEAYFFDKYYLLHYLENSEYFAEIDEKQAKYGDIVTYWTYFAKNRPHFMTDRFLYHSANVLDDDLQFEKSDTSLPWSIALRSEAPDEIKRKMKQMMRDEGENVGFTVKTRYFRPASKPIPSIYEILREHKVSLKKGGLVFAGAHDAIFGGALDGGYHAIRGADITEQDGKIKVKADPEFQLIDLLPHPEVCPGALTGSID
jgi:hypothetical protein